MITDLLKKENCRIVESAADWKDAVHISLEQLIGQFHLPGGGQVDMPRLMELIDRMAALVPVYRLSCRNDVSAAETAIRYFGL